jgi:hypothetical protein
MFTPVVPRRTPAVAIGNLHQGRIIMATDERKDRENETPKTKDENVSDLSAKKLNREEEEKVKGGINFRPTADLE